MTEPTFGDLICDQEFAGGQCDCCGRVVGRLRRSVWHGPHAICYACFSVWYDCEWTTNADIKRMVLEGEAAGTFPFPCPGQGADRIA